MSNSYSPGDNDNNILRKLLTGFASGEFQISTFGSPSSIVQPVFVSGAGPVTLQPSDDLWTVPVYVASPVDVTLSQTVLTNGSAHVQPVSLPGPVTTTPVDSILDAFGRFRVAAPAYIFDSQFTYNIAPLLWEPITSGSGATVTHDTTNRCALMTFSSTATGGKAILQTFEHFRYQPGRSQLVFATFNFNGGVSNCVKFVGYSDGTNGIEFQMNGTVAQWVILSGTTNGNETATQANWNLDKLDGTGASGLTLDTTKSQILVMDFQALYTGRVRVGFDIGGTIIFVHQFMHADTVVYPYLQSANLPMRAGMTCTDTVSTTMRFVCCSVSSNGGQEDLPGYGSSTQGIITAASGARTHILSVRPKTTFNSISNRVKFVLESVDIMAAGANPIFWELCLGQAITGTTTFTDVNTTYSAFEQNSAGTISGSPTIVLAAGYATGSASVKGVVSAHVVTRMPITLDAAGAVRALGTLSLIATGITGTSEVRCSFNWREIR